MPTDDLELAAEFCALVGAPNLLAYLDLPEQVSSGEAREALKARRKFMQGMQSNPKYKKEALFLIRSFTSLNEALEDPAAYLADTRTRSESVHLPVIEMTIRSVLAPGAAPTREQLEYLRRNAAELGVSERTFRARLEQIAAENGVTLPGFTDPSATSQPGDGPPQVPPEIHTATAPQGGDELHEAARYAPGPEAWGTTQRPRPSQAPTVLLNHDPEDEGQAPRLEILGEPKRRLRLGARIPEIRVRNGGEGEMGGTVRPNVDWLKVHPERLDPRAREQVVAVRVSSQRMPKGTAIGAVVITIDTGERAKVVYEIRRGVPVVPIVAALLVMGAASAIGGWVLVRLLVGG